MGRGVFVLGGLEACRCSAWILLSSQHHQHLPWNTMALMGPLRFGCFTSVDFNAPFLRRAKLLCICLTQNRWSVFYLAEGERASASLPRQLFTFWLRPSTSTKTKTWLLKTNVGYEFDLTTAVSVPARQRVKRAYLSAVFICGSFECSQAAASSRVFNAL